MPTIYIDNQPYEVDEGQNLLHVAISKGIDLPYFCWHPALGSVGACRQCAVQHFKDESDTEGRTVMACMTPSSDNLRCSVKHKTAQEFRERVIEWMMINHPHDCPVCDEGGECHLQDMTVMAKHNYRRYRFSKRTFKNQYLGPFINHEMNRCITCYRCVRYYQGVAGGTDLSAFSISNRVYFGRHEDGVLANEFSGNLVEICPTGVFTDKPFKETYTRKWDLQTSPSVCQLCSLGCNTLPAERYGSIRRLQNRYNPHVNGYFLCDRGRFGHSFVNSPKRLTVSKGQPPRLKAGQGVVGIGSPRASLENNFALLKAVGSENFYMGLSDIEAKLSKLALDILQRGPAKSATQDDVAKADACLILGEDLTNTAPMLALQIRKNAYEQAVQSASALKIADWQDQAIRNISQIPKACCISLMPFATKLDELAILAHQSEPESIASIAHLTAHNIDNEAPAPKGHSPDEELVASIVSLLSKAKRPVIIAGASLQSPFLMQAAANIAWALCKKGIEASVCLVLPEANSLGLALIGEQNLSHLQKRLQKERLSSVVVLENDLHKRLEQSELKAIFSNTQVVALDYLQHDTTDKAEIAIPTPPFSESTGSLLSSEGRAQRFYSVFVPRKPITEAWRSIAALFGQSYGSIDELGDLLSQQFAAFKPWDAHLERTSFRMLKQKIPRQTQEWSGRTANEANINISEQAPPKDPDSPLSQSMEGYHGHPPAALTPFFWAPGWNSVSALNKYLVEVGGDYENDHIGCRLFEPNEKESIRFFDVNPAPASKAAQYCIIPRHYIFGSEERAVYSKALSERIPPMSVGMSAEDVQRLKLKEGQELSVLLDGQKIVTPFYIEKSLKAGYVLVPLGLADYPKLVLPASAEIEPLESMA